MYAAEIDLKCWTLSPLSFVFLFVVRGSLLALIFFLLCIKELENKDSRTALLPFELVMH